MTDQKFSILIDINIDDAQWPDNLDPLAEKAISQAVQCLPEAIAGPVEISLLLTNDKAQQHLNAQWRQKNSATNVLSFPANEPGGEIAGFLGDISMARETMQREAEDLGKSFSDHFVHSLVHGFLHLIGYDHENDADALVMERLETKILADLGIADPYDNE